MGLALTGRVAHLCALCCVGRCSGCLCAELTRCCHPSRSKSGDTLVMAARTERRSEICPECGAVAVIEYTAVLRDDRVDRVDIDATCPNIDCVTRRVS